ncbi:MAG: hypothetical protein ACFFE4_12150, partial [Candidatus Thorarchaeota archaeon]
IQRIKATLPEVQHIVMFYNNGMIYQTTFEQEINIPKLGENLAEILSHIRKLYEICNYNLEDYKKIIFETHDTSIIILKLGEDSNIALFFRKEEDHELRLTAIKRYMNRIEELIDMDEKELILQEILTKEEEIKNMKEKIREKKDQIDNLRIGLKPVDEDEVENKEITKEIDYLEGECIDLTKDIEEKYNEINQLKEIIEKDHKKI